MSWIELLGGKYGDKGAGLRWAELRRDTGAGLGIVLRGARSEQNWVFGRKWRILRGVVEPTGRGLGLNSPLLGSDDTRAHEY